MMKFLSCLLSAVLVFPGSHALALAAPAEVIDPLERPALQARDFDQSMLTAIARAGERLIVAGERGLVLLSDDDGRTWRQVPAPVSVTITALAFPTPNHGWAVGHGGVVLHTVDAGEHWDVQLDGRRGAELVLDSVRADIDPGDGDSSKVLVAAQRLVEEGADKPLLALAFANAQRGIVVGAYGLAFATHDGGRSWRSIGAAIPNPRGMHLYAAAHDGERWYVAGEQGFAARSDDREQSFHALETPYRGSFFAIDVRGEEVLLAGLRGNAVRSADGGESFAKVPVPVPASLLSTARLADGRLLAVGQGGQLMQAGNAGFVSLPLPPGPPLNALVEAQDGALIGASWRGPVRIESIQWERAQ
ncbi:WD40/YVTN/BNR-like repeat-containing protein [Nitrincola sp. MINF-07-Sa-05]|uniref:WD40/YVTN/BNR-like repeat-containing protein n=1 Tax=Nitrincola salilacus TaxID=3400273 RepID=UPI00391855C5